jgi:hypothetical protein
LSVLQRNYGLGDSSGLVKSGLIGRLVIGMTLFSGFVRAVEDGGFFFALATAPAHVEDKLDDAWLEFAKGTEPKDNPAGDPPETRTGEKDNAASYSGVSLTEEAQAEKIKEGALLLSVRHPHAYNSSTRTAIFLSTISKPLCMLELKN